MAFDKQEGNDRMDGNTGRSELKLRQKLRFVTLTGEMAEAELTRVIVRVDQQAPACEIEFEVSAHTYARIIHGEWFHLFGVMGKQEEYGFDQELPIIIKAALRPARAALLVAEGKDAADVLSALSEDQEDALVQSEWWIALEVIQHVTLPEEFEGNGTLREGYRTAWRNILK